MSHRIASIMNQLVPDTASNSVKTTISSHCLDTARGVPASGLYLKLERRDESGHWHTLNTATTNEDGRVTSKDWDVIPGSGHYCVRFHTRAYFERVGIKDYLYSEIPVEFDIKSENLGKHYHIPLLLSPFGYSTYRGS